MKVLVPYKITLLSNELGYEAYDKTVLVPYKITLLSNSAIRYWYREYRFSTL